ncbi:MAG: glycine cleavage system protein GcvH [Acidobacteriota bacterium]
MADYPDSYAYTEEHEWLSVDGDVGTIGITHHAQEELGDVVYVELPDPGTRLEQGDAFGTIESVKAVSDLYAPVAGEVTEVNDDLVDRPEIVNEDPHGNAWMIKLRLDDPSQAEGLMSAARYREQIQE